MNERRKAPIHPYWILLAAILLPGAGHVLLGMPKRGLTMQSFMISLGWITWHLTNPHQSLVGRLAGGFFIYAMSVLDAYRTARFSYTIYQRGPAQPTGVEA